MFIKSKIKKNECFYFLRFIKLRVIFVHRINRSSQYFPYLNIYIRIVPHNTAYWYISRNTSVQRFGRLGFRFFRNDYLFIYFYESSK